jgi:hypothetical protein
MNNWFYIPSVLIGCGAFILAVLSVSVSMGWLSQALLMGVSDSAFAVYCAIASTIAIGLYVLSREAD